jgi:hypothetical protein
MKNFSAQSIRVSGDVIADLAALAVMAFIPVISPPDFLVAVCAGACLSQVLLR